MGRTLRIAVAVACLLVMSTIGGAAAAYVPPGAGDPGGVPPSLGLLREVLEQIHTSYVDEVSEAELIEAAIAGMVESLDPHSKHLDEEAFHALRSRTRGRSVGIGLRLVRVEGHLHVKAVADGSPAMRIGIKQGDVLTHVDAKPVSGLTRRQLSARMQGPVGTSVTVAVIREGQVLEYTLPRELVTIPSVHHRIEDDIGYIRLRSFNRQTKPGLRAAIADIAQTLGPRLLGYVLDLRNNGGGRLKDAVWVADSFLEHGRIVSTRGRKGDEQRHFDAGPGDLAAGKPIIIVINGRSASGSEIVAGALQDHRRAVVVGTTSFGKGSIQTVIPIPGHGALRLTTARYYTPTGRSIQGRGISPDIEIVQARRLPVRGSVGRREADLRHAFGTEQNNLRADMEPGAHAARNDAEDHQLSLALDLLRAIALDRSRMPMN